MLGSDKLLTSNMNAKYGSCAMKLVQPRISLFELQIDGQREGVPDILV